MSVMEELENRTREVQQILCTITETENLVAKLLFSGQWIILYHIIMSYQKSHSIFHAMPFIFFGCLLDSGEGDGIKPLTWAVIPSLFLAPNPWNDRCWAAYVSISESPWAVSSHRAPFDRPESLGKGEESVEFGKLPWGCKHYLPQCWLLSGLAHREVWGGSHYDILLVKGTSV